MRIDANAFVSLECTLRSEAGELIEGDDSTDRIEYVHGYGMLVPGLELALSGLEEGDRREILVPPSTGYGERDLELVMEVDRADFPDPAKVAGGDEFFMEFPDGDSQAMRVVEVRADSVVVDANHPLAGLTLRYSVHIHLVRPAAEEEIENAARELALAEDGDAAGCGPSCDHDHEVKDGPVHGLVALGVRRNAPN
jgi:FKBP-type peptidyl-prolyl cis-trans isomerase SlyD